MTKRPNGGPAFPCECVPEIEHLKMMIDNGFGLLDAKNLLSKHRGMSLRDWFAGQAIAGLMTANWTLPDAAEDAYRIADAMIKAREGGAP